MQKRKEKEGKMKSKKPRIYLDTVILRDCTHNRHDPSKKLVDYAESRKWSCVTSIFAIMELIDIEQEDRFLHKKAFIEKWSLDKIFTSRKQRDLTTKEFSEVDKYIREFTERNYKFIKLEGLTDEGWSLAIYMATNSNLNAADVIHLVTAWQAGCSIIVTRDEFFIKEARKLLKREKLENGRRVWSELRVCKPKDVKKNLKAMGYRNL